MIRLSNKFVMRFLMVTVVCSLILIAFGSWNILRISEGFKVGITNDFMLQRLGGEIVYLDEVLTMSARMAALTGDLQWEARYLSYVPKLDSAIKAALELEPEAYQNHAAKTETL